jgi:glycosyltransferase involved in cell wall biosynthesis
MTPKISKLVIVSHVHHYSHGGQIHAYGPYTREIDIWADLFPQVVIASPLRYEVPPNDCLPFTRSNISLVPQRETGGDDIRSKVVQILMLPVLLLELCRAMWDVDAIHVRCPGNLGLLGTIVAPMFSRRCVAKFAGQWNGHAGERFIVWLQRLILGSFWWRRGLVTVYGKWPDQPKQVTPFFTSMMTSHQVRHAAEAAIHKKLSEPLQILFSGRLANVKRVDVLLHAARILADRNVRFAITVIGDGIERSRLEVLADDLQLKDHVKFVGAVPFDEMMYWYERGHVLVLPSDHGEGWPKVLTEAMCHGLVCVATNHGLIPWLLGDKGYTFPVGDAKALADRFNEIVRDPDRYRAMSQAAGAWARNYSLEGLRDALQGLLSKHWDVVIERSCALLTSRTPTVVKE